MKLKPASLDWSLCHIERFGDTDIFPLPFEFQAIRHEWDSSLKQWLADQDVISWHERSQPYRRCLSPKARFGFRIATQLDPLDALIFGALVYEIGHDLEASRLPVSEKVVFSHRFVPRKDGQMYDLSMNYESFQEQSRNLLGGSGTTHVVAADIADFFPRLYSHPLENALDEATSKQEHVRALKSLLKKWNFSVSYGIPVGPAASRLLAEVAIDDVDRALLSEGYRHCRYSDDYRIFCKTERSAHEALATLANVLMENHGLTLQPTKTVILPAPAFEARFLDSEKAQERNQLTRRFREILKALGLLNPYEPIEYDELDPAVQKKVDQLNLVGILKEQIGQPESLDIGVTRFVLRRLGQLDDETCVDLVLATADQLYPVFRDVVMYLRTLRSLKPHRKKSIAERLIALMESSSLVGHLEYNQCWLYDTFTADRQWNHEDQFVRLYNEARNEFARRKLTLALGRAGQGHWFKSRKRNVLQLSAWERRAFLAAASCLPGDEASHWYRSIRRQLDELEKAVTEWARSRPFA